METKLNRPMESHNAYAIMLAKIRAFRATREVISFSLEASDVTIMQWLLLGAVQRSSHLSYTTAGKLALELDVSMPMVTRLTAILEKKGLISLRPLKNDKRTKCINLTPTGVSLIAKTEPMVKTALKDWLAPIPRENIDVYMNVILLVAYKL